MEGEKRRVRKEGGKTKYLGVVINWILIKMAVSLHLACFRNPKLRDMERMKMVPFKNMLPKGPDSSYTSEQ